MALESNEMDPGDRNYLEGVKDVLEAISAALETLQNEIDCLQAEISVATDDFVGLDELAEKYGTSDN